MKADDLKPGDIVCMLHSDLPLIVNSTSGEAWCAEFNARKTAGKHHYDMNPRVHCYGPNLQKLHLDPACLRRYPPTP